ncbi:MAG: sigma-70 family RNA polymerase sigma factor [Bacteroidetes bacterium]|mgnify:CR=1 FL=1|nr:sigma-70 family RNA polymerase sigma factor [Bacteroidota bacterium]
MITGNDLSDLELLKQYRVGGDTSALGILLQRYTLLLLGVAMKYLKDKDEAQDAVQQVFEKAIRNLPTGAIQNFKGWLYVLMRNHCYQLLRDKQYSADPELLNNMKGEGTDLEALWWKDRAIEDVQTALLQLEEAQRITIAMFYLEDKSYKEIMEATGYSFSQVKSYIQNGKRNLKLILTRNGNG